MGYVTAKAHNRLCWWPGRFPALERMAFNRVIPSQHLLPTQVTSVTLREIRPPYNSELGSEIGTFYLVRALAPPAHPSLPSQPGCSGWALAAGQCSCMPLCRGRSQCRSSTQSILGSLFRWCI